FRYEHVEEVFGLSISRVHQAYFPHRLQCDPHVHATKTSTKPFAQPMIAIDQYKLIRCNLINVIVEQDTDARFIDLLWCEAFDFVFLDATSTHNEIIERVVKG